VVTGHFPVSYVVSRSVGRIIWRIISAYIVVTDLFAVTYVVSHSVSRLVWRNISAYIVGAGLFAVTYVVSRSVGRIIWRRISAHIVGTGIVLQLLTFPSDMENQLRTMVHISICVILIGKCMQGLVWLRIKRRHMTWYWPAVVKMFTSTVEACHY
jgi:hypothetical protein